MRKLTAAVFLIPAIALLAVAQSAQQTTADRTRVIGEITAVDVPAGRVTVKSDSGNEASILVNGDTSVFSVPPGERSLEKAQKISFGDLNAGDRILARYASDTDIRSAPARQLIVMAAARIKIRQNEEREAWQKRSVSGVVVALNPKATEITIVSPQRDGIKQIVVSASKARRFRRYAPESIRFADARPSSFAELRPGDQLRALGERNADGTAVAAEEIISGAFRTIGGTVTSVNGETGEVRIKLFGNNQPLTLVAGKNSAIRRIPAKVATLIAQRAVSTSSKKTDAEDSQEIIERLPTIPVSDLKAGDVILTASAMGKDPTHLNAINVLAGIDGIISALQRAGGLKGAQLSTGLPAGVLDATAGQQ